MLYEVITVRLTNLEKVYWPAEGYTKGDLIAYYEQVADALLPHLQRQRSPGSHH